MPRKGLRKISAPDFALNDRKEVELPERHLISELLLRTEYDWAVTGGTGAGSILSDAAFRLFQQITVMSGGRPLHAIRGTTLGVIHRIWGKEQFAQTDPSDDTAGISETSRLAWIPLPFYVPNSYRPDEAALPSSQADARLIVDMAKAENIVSGEDGTPAISNGAHELYERALLGVRKHPFNKWAGVSIRNTVKPISQSGPITVDLSWLNRGQEVRAVIVEAHSGLSGTTEYTPDDSLVDKVGPLEIDGEQEYEEVRFDVLQALNKRAYQLGSQETGVAVLDPADDLRTDPGELWTVTSEEDPTLDLEVVKQSGDCRVIVTTVAVSRDVRAQRQAGVR